MTNKELQEILKQYPDDAEIIRHNVYRDMNAQWSGYEKVSDVRVEFGEFEQIFSFNSTIKGLLVEI